MYNIIVQLSAATVTKLLKGNNVTLKNQDGYTVTLVFGEANKKLFTKMKRNVKNSKGTRVNIEQLDDVLVQDVVDGGNILRSIKKGFKKIDKGFKQAGKYVKKNAGDIAESAKKIVPKKDLSTALGVLATAGIMAGTTAIGNPALGVPLSMAASKGIDAGVNTVYANDFSKKQTAKGWRNAAIKGTAETAVKTALNSAKSVGTTSKTAPSVPSVPTAIPVAEVVEGTGAKKRGRKPKPKGEGISIKLDRNIHHGAVRKGKEVFSAGSFMPIG
jgi:hypothetical protein